MKKILTGGLPLALLLGITLMGFPAQAQEDDASATKTSSKSLSERVKELEKKLAAVEESASEKFQQVHEDQLRLHFNLYGDAEYRLFGPSGSFPQSNGFYIGQTDLHIMGRYGDHLSFMCENVVEFDGQDPTIDLERILVAYAFDDKLQIGAGRDHTCFGYWNRTFHHGSHLQTTIDRPFFIAFEDGGSSGIPSKGGVVPSHFVGVFANGTFDLGASALKYELNVGNNGSIGLDGDGAGNPTDAFINFSPEGDQFKSKRVAGRLVFKPISDGGLAFGVAGVLSEYGVLPSDPKLALNPSLPSNMFFTDLAQLLLEGEVIYTDDKVEFLSEFYQFNNAIGGGTTVGSSNNTAFYIQAGYQVSADVKPYVRVENLDINGTDPYFRALLWSNKSVWLAGIRFEMVPLASSLKIEARSINDSGTASTELATAWGYGF